MTATPKRVQRRLLTAAIATGVLVAPASAQAHGMTCQTSDTHYKQVREPDRYLKVDDMPGKVCVVLGEDLRTGRGAGIRFSAYRAGHLYSQNVFIVSGSERCSTHHLIQTCSARFRVTPIEIR